jgi:hypothetical protein
MNRAPGERAIAAGPTGGLPVSAKHFQLLVVKALWDDDFRKLLLARPDEAMKDFDLTKDERAELQRIERDRFDDLVAEYRMRLTKVALGPGAHVAFNPQPDPPVRVTLDSLFRLRT